MLSSTAVFSNAKNKPKSIPKQITDNSIITLIKRAYNDLVGYSEPFTNGAIVYPEINDISNKNGKVYDFQTNQLYANENQVMDFSLGNITITEVVGHYTPVTSSTCGWYAAYSGHVDIAGCPHCPNYDYNTGYDLRNHWFIGELGICWWPGGAVRCGYQHYYSRYCSQVRNMTYEYGYRITYKNNKYSINIYARNYSLGGVYYIRHNNRTNGDPGYAANSQDPRVYLPDIKIKY
jgi:hypothetical protein